MYCGRGSREKVLFLEADSLKAMRSEMAVQSLAEQLENTHKTVTKAYHVYRINSPLVPILFLMVS